MLVLSRRIDEEIVIGEGGTAVSVTVVRLSKEKVRLGVKAPKDVPIHRREIYDLIHGNVSVTQYPPPADTFDSRLDAEDVG